MSHYFIEDESLKSEIKQFSYDFQGKEFKFISDNGLFSKEHVDYASSLLLNNMGKISGTLLDLGCGYGTIGIVLAGTYGVDVTFVDVNPKALKFTTKNCEINNVEAKCIQSDCFKNITGTYDNIVLNPPIHAGKDVIYEMYEKTYEYLSKGGSFFIVIQKKHGAESSEKKLAEIFGECNTIYKKKGFYIFQCIRNN